ncbi:MAG: hypothetical protein ABW212_12725 [Pseudonocardia sediminis]
MASHSTTDTETTTTDDDTTTTDTAVADAAAAGKPDADTTATGTTPTQPAATGTTATTDASTTITPDPSGSFVTGALALVGAGLGVASLTGTSLGDMMRARQELLGQITAATGGQIDQIEALYGSPWSTAALVNGTFALLAVIVGAVLLATRGRRPDTSNLVKAVALGGTVLGVIGLLVSGGMYLDLFAAAPTLPTMPGLGG